MTILRLFIAPFEGEQPQTDTLRVDPTGRVSYTDERPGDRTDEGVLIERWAGKPTGPVRWGEHHPQSQSCADHGRRADFTAVADVRDAT